MYARASALGVSLSTGSVAGDALAGLRMSAAPFSPLAVDLASVTPAAWVSELGTGLQYIDDETTPQTLPFAFSFYGQSYSSVFVSANGHISFGNPIPFKRTTWDGPFPMARSFSRLRRTPTGCPRRASSFPNLQNSRVFVNTVGQPGDRRFVVTWHDMRPCCSLSYPGSSFQLQLRRAHRRGRLRLSRDANDRLERERRHRGGREPRAHGRRCRRVLALQGCAITYTPNSGGYREANSCAPEPVNVPPVVEVGGPYASVEGAVGRAERLGHRREW